MNRTTHTFGIQVTAPRSRFRARTNDYRCAGVRRRYRRRLIRPRVLRSARTAARSFDLLAIATLRIGYPSPMLRLERTRTLPVVHGGNRIGFLPRCRTRLATQTLRGPMCVPYVYLEDESSRGGIGAKPMK
jgi:hypothetical protein